MRTSLQISMGESGVEILGSFGDCFDCGRRHQLPDGNAQALAADMMREFESIQRLDYRVREEDADSRLAFANLYPAGHGSMFGVLECEDLEGQTVVLRAFSSLPEGIRQIDGWVLPVLSPEVYEGMILPAQYEIKKLTAELNGVGEAAEEYERKRSARKAVSQVLWKKMCAAYRFRNFRGEERSLKDAVLPGTPITGGMGECCAPKLLNHAALHGLRPVSLAEFYWGEGRIEGSRVHGQFYPSCKARCQPILGYMVCGIDE
jgi:hypothetical protein